MNAGGEISIIAVQKGKTFETYTTKRNTTINMVCEGNKTAQEMFKDAQDTNAMMTWVFRGLGFIVMWIGISMVFGPFVTFADVIPFLGDILGMGVGFFSFILAAVISLVVIAIAWIAARPLLGGGLLAAGIVLLVMAKSARGSKSKPAAAA